MRAPQLPRPAAIDGQRRGELGVWMGESGGPGVRILRITQAVPPSKPGCSRRRYSASERPRSYFAASTANLIRQIAIGQIGYADDLARRQPAAVAGHVAAGPRAASSDWSARHRIRWIRAIRGGFDKRRFGVARRVRLEQQINSLTQELATLRQELTQLRSTGPVQTGLQCGSRIKVHLRRRRQRSVTRSARRRGSASGKSRPPRRRGLRASRQKPAVPPPTRQTSRLQLRRRLLLRNLRRMICLESVRRSLRARRSRRLRKSRRPTTRPGPTTCSNNG